jgi:hypothetical protein
MKVHIHANCQAVPLAGMLKEVYPNWDISYFEAHAKDIIERIDEHYARIRNADLVLTQPIHSGYRGRADLSIDWVRENVRRDATLLVFPSMHFTGHHPELDNLPIPGIPFLSSLLAAHLIADGQTPAAALRHMLSDELLRDSDIEAEISISLDEMKRREIDDQMDILITPFLEKYCRAKALFHIQNHPLRETMVFITNQILDRIGCTARVPVDGRDYQREPHVPPLPAIARYLRTQRGDLEGAKSSEMVLIPGYPPMTQADYYGCMLEGLARLGLDEIFQVIKSRWPTVQLLRRLAAQGSALPGASRWLEV